VKKLPLCRPACGTGLAFHDVMSNKSLWGQAANEPTLMIILAIVLCLTALWAVGCGVTPSTP
jgi:hypothetical protein